MDGQRASKRRRTSAGGSPAPAVATDMFDVTENGGAGPRVSSPKAVAAAAASEVEDDEAFAQRLQEEENARYERERAEVQRRAAEWRRQHEAMMAFNDAQEEEDDDDEDDDDDDDENEGTPEEGAEDAAASRAAARRARAMEARARLMEMHRFFGAVHEHIAAAESNPADRAGLAALVLSDRDFTEDDYERLLALDNTAVRRGVSATALHRIPTTTWGGEAKVPAQEANERGEATHPGLLAADASESIAPPLAEEHSRCAVCLEQYTVGDRVRHLPCLHSYHQSCIDRWLSASVECPVCRVDVNALMD